MKEEEKRGMAKVVKSKAKIEDGGCSNVTTTGASLLKPAFPTKL